eukprot:1964901-Pyramimonas_sp.AAC.1
MPAQQKKYLVCSKRGCKGWAWCSTNSRHCMQCGSRFKQCGDHGPPARPQGGGGGSQDVRPDVEEEPAKPGRWRKGSR